MKLSIIIVSYNTMQLLADCIQSVQTSLGDSISYEIIVVDNDSKDNSIYMLKTQYPNIKLLENKYNAGFAKANNQGLQESSGEYVLLLNSDTIVLGNSINTLIDFLDRNIDTAICGPKLLNSDMTLQLPCRRGFPRLINSIAHFSHISRLFPKNRILGSYLMTYMDSTQNHEVDAVSGACMLIRPKVLEGIGGLLDEAYFMHFEDIDLCYRAKKYGFKVYYVHNAEVIHLKGQSSKLRSSGVTRNFFDSAIIYFRNNYKRESKTGYFLTAVIIKLMKYFTLAAITLKTGLNKKVQSKSKTINQ